MQRASEPTEPLPPLFLSMSRCPRSSGGRWVEMRQAFAAAYRHSDAAAYRQRCSMPLVLHTDAACRRHAYAAPYICSRAWWSIEMREAAALPHSMSCFRMTSAPCMHLPQSVAPYNYKGWSQGMGRRIFSRCRFDRRMSQRRASTAAPARPSIRTPTVSTAGVRTVNMSS